MSPRTRQRPRPKITHSKIVEAQQDLLKWCPNVANASKKDLEYICWACGGGTRQRKQRMTRCHIKPFQKGEIEEPDNFVLLCDPCHREQPDELPKEVLKYWLYTRESSEHKVDREHKVGLAAVDAMRDELGELLFKISFQKLFPNAEADMERYVERYIERYPERYAERFGQRTSNVIANMQWVYIQDLYDSCIQNRQGVEEMQREFDSCRDDEN